MPEVSIVGDLNIGCFKTLDDLVCAKSYLTFPIDSLLRQKVVTAATLFVYTPSAFNYDLSSVVNGKFIKNTLTYDYSEEPDRFLGEITVDHISLETDTLTLSAWFAGDSSNQQTLASGVAFAEDSISSDNFMDLGINSYVRVYGGIDTCIMNDINAGRNISQFRIRYEDSYPESYRFDLYDTIHSADNDSFKPYIKVNYEPQSRIEALPFDSKTLRTTAYMAKYYSVYGARAGIGPDNPMGIQILVNENGIKKVLLLK